MGNIGIKVSRQGFDVKTCADHQLLFSSAFRMPVVRASGIYNLTDPSQTKTIYTHNLGYYPVCLITYLDQPPPSSTDRDNRLHWDAGDPQGPAGYIFIDTTKIWYNQNEFAYPSKIAYFVLNLNLEVAYTAPVIDNTPDTQGAITTDWGFKVSKDGVDVKTAGLADLQSFSGSSLGGVPVRHQIIHKIGTTSVSNGNTASIAHGLGYKPMFLFYVKQSGAGYFIDLSDYEVTGPDELTERSRAWADTVNIYYRNNTGNTVNLAYLIFKDPLL